jgi:hypothetical protein
LFLQPQISKFPKVPISVRRYARSCAQSRSVGGRARKNSKIKKRPFDIGDLDSGSGRQGFEYAGLVVIVASQVWQFCELTGERTQTVVLENHLVIGGWAEVSEDRRKGFGNDSCLEKVLQALAADTGYETLDPDFGATATEFRRCVEPGGGVIQRGWVGKGYCSAGFGEEGVRDGVMGVCEVEKVD